MVILILQNVAFIATELHILAMWSACGFVGYQVQVGFLIFLSVGSSSCDSISRIAPLGIYITVLYSQNMAMLLFRTKFTCNPGIITYDSYLKKTSLYGMVLLYC